MTKQPIFYGIYSSRVYPALTTPDKQLQCHGTYVRDDFWECMTNMILFFERELPGDVFTIVINDKPVI